MYRCVKKEKKNDQKCEINSKYGLLALLCLVRTQIILSICALIQILTESAEMIHSNLNSSDRNELLQTKAEQRKGKNYEFSVKDCRVKLTLKN